MNFVNKQEEMGTDNVVFEEAEWLFQVNRNVISSDLMFVCQLRTSVAINS